MDKQLIKENICKLKEEVKSLSLSDNLDREIKIVPATKTQSKELIDFIETEGLLEDVGENKVQEFVQKYTPESKLNWHIIGQLQSNKVKYIIGKVALIHSLDRLSLADEIQKQAKKHGVTANCLIEINMGSELSKGGINPDELLQFAQSLRAFDSIKVCGIMTVMPNVATAELIEYYKKFDLLNSSLLREKGGNIVPTIVSCGMSNDYRVAIEYGGSNLIRPGRVLFGERVYTTLANALADKA